MKFPGPDHALALHNNGTLVTWGDNTYGQLNLLANVAYDRVEAGDGFSLGLGTDGKVLGLAMIIMSILTGMLMIRTTLSKSLGSTGVSE